MASATKRGRGRPRVEPIFVFKALSFIQKHYTQELSLRKIANVMNINPNYLISRRLVIGANYGGSGIVASQDQSINSLLVTNTITTHPRFLNLGIYYMLGPTYEPFTNIPKTGLPGD